MPIEPSSEFRARRRRAAWWVLAVALLVAVVLVPPYVSVDRYSHRIAASMSESLGRPVHLDNVSLHMLPRPGLTLQNLVVSEDPAFGSEPVIRANEVDASVRLSSLWRHQVEFGTVRFIDPSVNLVRRADGRWNLEGILVHAAERTTAPTAQARASDAPRFPYIEATGGRINIKQGLEKIPFALTDADFALWLPEADTWQLRLSASPARTDTSITAAGTMRLEGTLKRAAHVAEVPVSLAAHWTGAPLGEASRMLTGADAGWRGSLDVDSTLEGTLGTAKWTMLTRLRGLRRAAFVPAKTLDLDVHCDGSMSVPTAVLTAPQCTVDSPRHSMFGNSDLPSPVLLTAAAAALDLTGLHATQASITVPGVELERALDFVRLLSERMPATAVHGTVVGSFALADDGWQGPLTATLLPAAAQAPLRIAATVAGNVLTMAPLSVPLAGSGDALTLTATAAPQQIYFTANGTATPDEIDHLRALAPPLGDGLDAALPQLAAAAGTSADTETQAALRSAAIAVNVTCSRTWGAPQTCVAVTAVTPRNTGRRGRRH